jgi:hypothetical protein
VTVNVITRILASCTLAVAALASCSCAGNPSPRVDLEPARAAVASARAAGAQERAEAELRRAESSLAEAEELQKRGGGTKVARAQMLAEIAQLQARLAAAMARPADAAAVPTRPPATRDSGAAVRRLEDQITLLTQELQMADGEIMRGRAKGIDTKAEASSAIAEARVLMGREGDGRARAPVLARCRELLASAETQLAQEAFGAARWQALKCQRLLENERRPSDGKPGLGSGR